MSADSWPPKQQPESRPVANGNSCNRRVASWPNNTWCGPCVCMIFHISYFDFFFQTCLPDTLKPMQVVVDHQHQLDLFRIFIYLCKTKKCKTPFFDAVPSGRTQRILSRSFGSICSNGNGEWAPVWPPPPLVDALLCVIYCLTNRRSEIYYHRMPAWTASMPYSGKKSW